MCDLLDAIAKRLWPCRCVQEVLEPSFGCQSTYVYCPPSAAQDTFSHTAEVPIVKEEGLAPALLQEVTIMSMGQLKLQNCVSDHA